MLAFHHKNNKKKKKDLNTLISFDELRRFSSCTNLANTARETACAASRNPRL